jgi:hypothetical protein
MPAGIAPYCSDTDTGAGLPESCAARMRHASLQGDIYGVFLKTRRY